MRYIITKKGEVIAELKKGANYIMLVDPSCVQLENLFKAISKMPCNIQVVTAYNPSKSVKLLGIEKVK